MEKIKQFLKGKGIGYYIVIGDIILSLILGIVFFATYQGAMANNAAGNLPEVIGVCIILGAILDIVTLVLPEYKFIHIGALIAYCLSLMKEIYLIPNLIADQINGVTYQGGNFPLNLFYIIMQFIIVISAVVATFLGFLNKQGEQEFVEEVKRTGRFSKNNLIKIISGACVFVIAISISAGTLASLNSSSKSAGQTVKLDEIQEEWKDKTIEYDFDPTQVVYREDTHPYKDATAEQIINNVSSSPDRFLHNKVYEFEGKYTEAYQGNFNYTYSYIYLWEDGLYNGTASGTNIYGYWYNQTAEGLSCLVLKDTAGNDMVCNQSRDPYYDWYGDLKSNVNGGRTFKMNGFMYTPVIGIYLDHGDDDLQYEFREEFDKTSWTVNLIRNDLRHSAIINPDEATWTLPDMTKSGDQDVKVSWQSDAEGEDIFETSLKINVGEDKATYEFDFSAESVKKTYRYVDLFDPTGIRVTRVTDDRREEIDASTIPYEFDYDNNQINFPMTNGQTYNMPVTFDLSEEANTLHGTLSEKDVTVIVTSPTEAKISDGANEATFSITLEGTQGLASIVVGDKISGSDEAYNLLPEEFQLIEQDGMLKITLEIFMRSTTKANSYNQTTDTYFIFGDDSSKVTLIWLFNYNNQDMTQYMECSYTMDGTNLTINSLVGVDSSNQWQWSTRTYYNLQSCSIDDLPFYPY